jgi:hypothetical protein
MDVEVDNSTLMTVSDPIGSIDHCSPLHSMLDVELSDKKKSLPKFGQGL